MTSARRILITGCEGFIGKALCRRLREAGNDVWGWDRVATRSPQTRQVDLLDAEQIRAARADLPVPEVVVHTAAAAHEELLPPGQTRVSWNTASTENILAAVKGGNPHFIFLSSVAVYGEAGRNGAVTVDAQLRPSTNYGLSKLLCERMIGATPLTSCDILRLAPVFDEEHLKDVRKRVYLPGIKAGKIRIVPPPDYSLCHINTLTAKILELISQPSLGRRVRNVADPMPYRQSELLARFPGRAWPLPEPLLSPFYWLLWLIPGKTGYALRCFYWKLFRSNVYDISSIGGMD